jgi:membrane protease subunit (stomatin/prohibitin family)
MGFGDGGLGGGGLMAARAGTRMRSRQQYRTMSRMQRRRSYMQERMGVRQDFQSADEQYEEAPAAAPAEPDYTAELERLAQLRDQGVITDADFDAKKKQILGI